MRVAGAADSAAAVGSRELVVEPGTGMAEVARQLRLRGWESAYVLRIDARSMELLCEDLGSFFENRAFNQVMHRVLGIAEQVRLSDPAAPLTRLPRVLGPEHAMLCLWVTEQVRYCDAKVNPTYNGRQDDPLHPINCTWGFHRPPELPQQCGKTKAEILDARNSEVPRTFHGGPSMGSWNSWSTNDRAGYLYHQYMH